MSTAVKTVSKLVSLEIKREGRIPWGYSSSDQLLTSLVVKNAAEEALLEHIHECKKNNIPFGAVFQELLEEYIGTHKSYMVWVSGHVGVKK